MFLLVPAYPGSPGQKAVKRLCVCVCSTVIIFLHYYEFSWGLAAGYQPRPQVVDRGTTARYGGQLRYKRVTSPDKYAVVNLAVGRQEGHPACKNLGRLCGWGCH